MSGISKSQVSWLCEEIDGRLKAFLDRSIEGDWPYLWLDATYVKVRLASRVVSVAVIVAVGVNSDGRREVLGLDIGPSEAEAFLQIRLPRPVAGELVEEPWLGRELEAHVGLTQPPVLMPHRGS